MAVTNKNTDVLRELFVNLKPHIERFTEPQKRLLQVLMNHPDGLSSRELTHLTGILNKSDVLDPKLRLFLAVEHIGLEIKRKGKQWYWKLVPIQSLIEVAQ